MYKLIQHMRGFSLIDDFEEELASTCVEVSSKNIRQTVLEEWI